MGRLWKNNFGWRPSLVDSRALTGLGGSSLTPRLDIPLSSAEMDTWWRVIGGENTLWRWAEIFFGTNHEVLSDTVWADNLATLCYIALRLLDVLF